jgi:hypothetical protein
MSADPSPAPFAYRTIRGACERGNLLVAQFGMFPSTHNDPSPHCQRLRCGMSSDEMMKVFGFIGRQFYAMSGFGTTHLVSPPTSSLSSLVGTVKLGKIL